jgi:predicted transcriptional regulator YdeE
MSDALKKQVKDVIKKFDNLFPKHNKSLFAIKPVKPPPVPKKGPRSLPTIAKNNRYEEFLRRAVSDNTDEEELLSRLFNDKSKDVSKNLLIEKELDSFEKKALIKKLQKMLLPYFQNLYLSDYFSTSLNGTIPNTIRAINYMPEIPSNKSIIESLTERKIIDVCLLYKKFTGLSESDIDSLKIGKAEHENDDKLFDTLVAMSNVKAKNSVKQNFKEINEVDQAIAKFREEGKIISIMKETENAYADVIKIRDKYTIRLGDGNSFVASDNIIAGF